MSELFFPSQNTSVEEIFATNDKEAINAFLRNNILQNSRCLLAHTPYCISPRHPSDGATLATFNNMSKQNREQLMCMVDNFGNSTRTLAALYDRHLANLDLQVTAGLVGAVATAKDARLTGLQKAILNYQMALEALNKHSGIGRGPSAQKAALRADVHRKYDILQREYRTELNKLARPEFRHKNRGSALNNAERGITVAEARRGRHLYVSDTAEARQLARLASGTRFVGNGMIALDAGIRANNVYGTYTRGGNWQRTASVELAGFGAGGAAGIVTGKMVIAGLTAIGLGLTPVGWVIMIGAAVTAGAVVGTQVDKKAKDFTATTWDRR